MSGCVFVSDLHGRGDRFEKLLHAIGNERPRAVFVGGDLLPPSGAAAGGVGGAFGDLALDSFLDGLRGLRRSLGADYPRVFVIMGNDDPRSAEPLVMGAEASHVWEYAHMRRLPMDGTRVYGYACVPPTPFLLKDWERYDVSRGVDPGAVSPEEGVRTVAVPLDAERHRTIAKDLDLLVGDDDLEEAVFLFHAPPYDTALDLAALRGKSIDHAPLDPHVGSVAIRRFIEGRQPLLTLHGHVHESARLSGSWRDRLGRTHMFSAAHDGSELAVVRFDLGDLDSASRELL